jgi:hypothetical protein
MTKDQFCTYVQGILDMELEIARITHKTKEDIELVGALKLIQDALKKVEDNEVPFYLRRPIMPPTYPDISSPPWTITYDSTGSTTCTDGTQIYTTYNKSKKNKK